MNRIAELRKERHISQAKLGADIKAAQNTVSQWEKGLRDPDTDTIKKLANYFNVSVDYLLGNTDYSANPNKKIGIKIPVLGNVQAGIPIEAIEEILDYEEITEEMASQGEHFALRVQGNSMEPRIMEGDVVIVRQQPDIDSGDVAVVLVNGDSATVKKVVKHENGISLVAFNPTYSPMFYTFKEIEELPISIVGKVVELRGKF